MFNILSIFIYCEVEMEQQQTHESRSDGLHVYVFFELLMKAGGLFFKEREEDEKIHMKG